jgi:hypothetical protein
VAVVRPQQRPAVVVLLNDFAATVRRIEQDRQVTLDCTPRITYRILIDVLAKREGRGFLDEPVAVREAFAELIELGTT